MTSPRDLRLLIKNRRSEGVSDYAIAKELKVSKPTIGRLMKRIYPGEKVARQLSLPVICHICHRKEKKPRTKNPAPSSPCQQWWRGLPKAEQNRLIQSLFEVNYPAASGRGIVPNP